MTARITRRSLACALGILISLLSASAAKRPNILFAFADDWGWPHAGAYGDKTVKTPAFDRLAKEGVLFEHAFISSPSCSPSRNAVITGQQFYRLEEGASLRCTLDFRKPNFMYLLRDNGYEIAHMRKAWGPGDFEPGGYQEHPCGPMLESFEQFMKNRDTDKPFCFWLGTSDPHRSYKLDSGRDSGMDIDNVHVPEFYPNNETIRSDIADYYWEVQRWDSDVATALKQLEEAGELDNTIIVMTGDHGMPFPRCKGNLYDWGSRVPLAIRWGDKVKPGRTLSDFTSLTDLAPTFLTAAGIDVPEVMTGNNLLPILTSKKKGRADRKRDFVVYGRERHGVGQKLPSMGGYPSRAIRTDDWLLILNLEADRWPAGVPSGATHPKDSYTDCDAGPTKSFLIESKDESKIAKYYDLSFAKRAAVELYDCNADPDQVNNLADDPKHKKTLEKLKKQLTAYLTNTEDPRFTDAPVLFDQYPYRADYMTDHFKENGYRYSEETNWIPVKIEK